MVIPPGGERQAAADFPGKIFPEPGCCVLTWASQVETGLRRKAPAVAGVGGLARPGRPKGRVTMKKSICLLIILAAAISCSGKSLANLVGSKIDRIENGLTAFTSPRNVFQAGPPKSGNVMTLPERMRHYHTPGLSIAVIEDFKLERASRRRSPKYTFHSPPTKSGPQRRLERRTRDVPALDTVFLGAKRTRPERDDDNIRPGGPGVLFEGMAIAFVSFD